MNWERGSRRIAWVLTFASIPFLAMVAYSLSDHQSGYRAELITSDFPTPDTDSPARTAVEIPGVGVAYFDGRMVESLADAEFRRLFSPAANPDLYKPRPGVIPPNSFVRYLRDKYPMYSDLKDVDLERKIFAKYPEMRKTVDFREFRVERKYSRRPVWAGLVALAAVAALAIVLHGLISITKWVVSGFHGD